MVKDPITSLDHFIDLAVVGRGWNRNRFRNDQIDFRKRVRDQEFIPAFFQAVPARDNAAQMQGSTGTLRGNDRPGLAFVPRTARSVGCQ